MSIVFVGIDLAKSVFAPHGVDERGKAVLVRPALQQSLSNAWLKAQGLVGVKGPVVQGPGLYHLKESTASSSEPTC